MIITITKSIRTISIIIFNVMIFMISLICIHVLIIHSGQKMNSATSKKGGDLVKSRKKSVFFVWELYELVSNIFFWRAYCSNGSVTNHPSSEKFCRKSISQKTPSCLLQARWMILGNSSKVSRLPSKLRPKAVLPMGWVGSNDFFPQKKWVCWIIPGFFWGEIVVKWSPSFFN